MKAVDIRVIRVLQNTNDVIRRSFQVIDNQNPLSCLHDGRPSDRPVFRRRWHIPFPGKIIAERKRQEHPFMGEKSYNRLRRMNKILSELSTDLPGGLCQKEEFT